MSKASKIILGILVLLAIFMIIAEANKPEPLDWSASYYRKDKIPKGSFIFYEQIEKASQDLKIITQPPYEFLQKKRSGTYFFLNRSARFSKPEAQEILKFAKNGNTVFIAGKIISPIIRDSLDIAQKSLYNYSDLDQIPQFKLKSPQLTNKIYTFSHNTRVFSLDSLNPKNSEDLGYVRYKNSDSAFVDSPNFAKFSYGEGRIFVHTSPVVFTNYFLLKKNNIEYMESLLAYVNLDKTIYWDAFHKVGKPGNTSLLHILLSNRYLQWTYYLILIGAVIFVIFEGKRKQKKIPVVPPLKNKTFEYTRTVAGMYLDKKAHHVIVQKEVNQLLSFIRQRLGLSTAQINPSFLRELSEKSNIQQAEIDELFHYIDALQKKGTSVKQKELIHLNHSINDFKNKV